MAAQDSSLAVCALLAAPLARALRRRATPSSDNAAICPQPAPGSGTVTTPNRGAGRPSRSSSAKTTDAAASVVTSKVTVDDCSAAPDPVCAPKFPLAALSWATVASRKRGVAMGTVNGCASTELAPSTGTSPSVSQGAPIRMPVRENLRSS